jgi:hypothetical protein
VAVDSLAGAHDADPDGTSSRSPERQRDHADGLGGGATLAEPRSRSEYYDAIRPDETRPRSGWDTAEVAADASKPSLDSILLNSERASHIIDGDKWGGGHRHGTGRPGKTEFPAGWDDKKITGLVADVACVPDDGPVWQANKRWRARGVREDVTIYVIVRPDGKIWSAWPEEGGPGVVRNPS